MKSALRSVMRCVYLLESSVVEPEPEPQGLQHFALAEPEPECITVLLPEPDLDPDLT